MMDETKKARLEELEAARNDRVLSAEETEELHALRSEAGLNGAVGQTDEAKVEGQTETPPVTAETPAGEATANTEAQPAEAVV